MNESVNTADVMSRLPSLRGTFSRRMLLMATGMTLTAGVASALLAGCGGDDDDAGASDDDQNASGTGDTETATSGEADEPTEASDDDSAVSSGGRLVRAASNDAENLDPHRRRTAYAGDVIQEMAVSAVALNPNLEFEGILLDGWEVSDDGLLYRLHVRPDRFFQDGTAVDAEALMTSWERSNNEEATWPDQWYGATWELVDDMTVEMHMPEPNAGVFLIMGYSGTAILSPTSIEQHGGDLSEGAVGSGPFKFKEWDVNQQIVLEPWEDYINDYSHAEGTEPARVDELVFRVIPDEQTQIASFESGEVNVIEIPSLQVSNFEGNDEYELLRNEQGTTVAFLAPVMPAEIDGWAAPFDDQRVRQALAHAVNAEEIIEGILAGLAIRNRSTMPTGNPGYTDKFQEDMGYDYDPEQAVALLEEAGWVNGSGGVRERDGESLSILFRSVSETTLGRISQLIQNQLSQVGFEVEYEGQERALFYEGLRSGESQLVLMDYNWGEPDIVWWLGNDTTIACGGYGEFNPEFTEIAAEGWIPVDPFERAEHYYNASQIMTADAAIIPLYTPVDVIGMRREVKDFKLGAQGRWVYIDAYVEEG